MTFIYTIALTIGILSSSVTSEPVIEPTTPTTEAVIIADDTVF